MKRKLLSVLLTFCLAFSLLPTAALADGENVAKIGGTNYATLAAALEAAKDGETVTLLADATEDVTINKSITLDLGGKTLTNTNAGKATISVTGGTVTVKSGAVQGGTGYYNIEVTKGSNANLTLEGVTATAGNTGSSMIDNWGTLTINSGTYTGGLDVVKSEEGSTLNIHGGKFTLNYSTSGYTGVILNYGTATITDGEFIQNATSGRWNHPQVVATGIVEGYTAITKITGGTFTNNKSGESIFHGIGKATSDNFEVSGGTFNKSVPDGFMADGYIPVRNADGTYGVKEGKFVAEVGSTGYETFDEAIAAANASTNSKTIYLRENVTVDHQIVINNAKGKTVTLDLKGLTLTSTYAINTSIKNGSYALVNNTPLTIKNGTFAAGRARAIGALAALTLNGATVTQTLTGGHACVAFCKEGKPYTIKNSTINGAYAVCNFADNATITISDSELNGTGNTLYHNGSNYGLKLTVKNTTITSSGGCGVYISGSTSAQANAANQNGAGGYQEAGFTGCTISGAENGVEVKYTDLTLNGCTVKSTSSAAPSYSQNNNGSAASGFAVVSTDNAMNNTTPKPEGTIIIKGNGKYTGPVGLGSLESVKTKFEDFTDNTIQVSGGTFSSAVLPEYCAPGFVPKDNGDGTFGVQEYKPIEVWTGYSGTKVASYATVAEAAAALGANKWIVVARDYTLTEDFEIKDGVYLDVAKDASLTVAEGVTLTVAADAKRLGVRAEAALVNNGTILVCGSSTKNGFAMLYGTFSGNELTVPEGYFLDNNGSNYFATANADALYEITFGDDTVKRTADSTNIKGGNIKQIKLLNDVTGGWSLDESSVGAEVVLDLNGHTLSYSGTNPQYATLNVYNKVTIKNGTIKYDGTKRGAIDLVGSGDLTIASNVVIDGGASYGIFTSGTSKLTVEGTVKANGFYAIAGNGSKDNGGYVDNCDITVNDGAVISAPNGIAIYHPELGTVTVNGGTISGHTGIELCAGKLVVSGGSITATGDNMNATGSQNAILDGAAVSIINRDYPGGTPTAEITGGIFTASGSGAQTVKAYDYRSNAVAEWTTAGESVNISGGSFSSIPSNMSALCAAGYIPFKNADGTYGVTRPSSGSSGSYDPTYSVSTPSKTENGSVTVSPKSASKGDTVTVTVKPDSGYVLETLTVTDKNGNELTLKDKGNGKYTFTMPAGKVEVKATFMEDNSVLNFFYDVPNDAYFYEAVKWAVENGITTGVGNYLFAPEQPCTRAQIVTFLWRAAGSPEPKGAASGMTDVVSGSYYEKAVAWAIENGITTGTTTSTFSPDATCTRAQAVTFLARALNAKAASAAEFSDVPTDSYFADAVAWAAANGVTEGIGGGLFGSDNDCTRGQIVTFLYRAYNK